MKTQTKSQWESSWIGNLRNVGEVEIQMGKKHILGASTIYEVGVPINIELL